MSTGFVLQSLKKPELYFPILEYDTTTKKATLKGPETGVIFTEVITKEFLKEWQYRVVKEGDIDAKPIGVQA